jgi:hypothetical protein
MKRYLFAIVLQLTQVAHGVIVAQVFDRPLQGDFDFETIRTFYDLDLDRDGISDFWVISNGDIVELLPFGNNRIFSSIGQSGTRRVRNLSEEVMIGPIPAGANPRFTGIEDSRISFDFGESFIYQCLAQFGGSVSCSSTLPSDPEQRTHYGLEFGPRLGVRNHPRRANRSRCPPRTLDDRSHCPFAPRLGMATDTVI